MLESKPPKVLVAIASREGSESALDFAVAEARRRGAGVHLVHAVPPVLLAPDQQSWEISEGSLRDLGHDLLAAAARTVEHRLGPDHPVSTELVHGPAGPALVAEAKHAAVVVLQRRLPRDRGHVPSLSVTNAVASRAHVPVVIVPTGWDEHAADAPVCVAVKQTETASEVLRRAIAEARSRKVPVRILHAWRFNEAFDDVVFAGDDRSAYEDQVRAQIAATVTGLLGDKDVEVQVEVRHGAPADLLVEESRRGGLLLLGRHESALPRLPHLGSVVRAVLREARCPVMVVDPAPERSDAAADGLEAPRPVVVGVDGSRAAASAVRRGAHEARALGAPLRLVHVVPDHVPLSGMLPLTPADLAETAQAILRRAEDVARTAVPDLDVVETRTPRGPRVRGLAESAVDARLLIVGRDRPALERLVSGRTAAGVAERSACTVEVVTPDWQEAPHRGLVLAGVREPRDAAPLLAHVFPLAAERRARLVLLHAWKLPNGYDDIVESREALADAEERARAGLEPVLAPFRAAYPELPVEVRIAHDRAAHALARAAREADLLVLLRRRHPMPAGLHLGGTARSLLRAAPCTVRIVAPADVIPPPVLTPGQELTSEARVAR